MRISQRLNLCHAARHALLLGCLAILVARMTTACGDEKVWREDAIGTEMTRNTLEGFRFEGLPLSASLAEFKRRFPAAQVDTSDELDRKAGLTCYTLSDLKSADVAQFYFFGNRLYQIDIEYARDRIESKGGMEAVMRRLVGMFGNPDNAYGNRRTWQQPTCGRRADFYSSRDGGRLIVTDTNISARVEARQKRTALEENVQLGF
jgi:hypothetical protein